MAKQLTNEEFMEKIKSLHFGGSKKSTDAACSKCGLPIKQHLKAIMIPIRVQMRRPASEEKSFAA